MPPAPAPPAPVPLSVARATTPSLEPATAAVTQPSQPPYQGYYTVPAPIVQLAQGGYEYRYLDPNQTLNPSVTYYQPVSNYYFAANLATEPTAESEDAQDEAVVTEQPDPVQPVEAAEEFEENEEEEESDDEVEVREPPQPGQESPSAGYLAALTSAAAAAAAAETR